MARILEHHAKAVLARHGIDIPRGAVVSDGVGAAVGAAALGERLVVKALVAANRRAKNGGVTFVDGPGAARKATERLLGTRVVGLAVERVLIEEHIDADREIYLSLLLDSDRCCPVAVASVAGGIDFETAAAADPGVVHVLEMDPLGGDLPHKYRYLWQKAGLTGQELVAATGITVQAASAFRACDATLLELNPIGLRDGRATALGALLAVDDQALGRQPELAREAGGRTYDSWRPPTPLEVEASAIAATDPYRGTVRFIQLEGEIGMLVGGGGGSLVFFDAVRRAGGTPACYTEIGGNPSAEKVQGLADVVLRCPGVQGLLVGHNITNNTQVDLIAQGVVGALATHGIDPRRFPVVAREVGTNDEVGRRIFETAGVEYLGAEWTMDAAAQRLVERVKGMTA